MALTVDLEMSLKVTENHCNKGTLWMKFELG